MIELEGEESAFIFDKDGKIKWSPVIVNAHDPTNEELVKMKNLIHNNSIKVTPPQYQFKDATSTQSLVKRSAASGHYFERHLASFMRRKVNVVYWAEMPLPTRHSKISM